MKRPLNWSSFTPWAGLFMGGAAWFAHNQVSMAVYWKCNANGPLLTGGTAVLAAAVTLLGGWISWSSRQPKLRTETDRPDSRAFAGMVSAGAAGLFVFAIILQGLTGFLVPECRPW